MRSIAWARRALGFAVVFATAGCGYVADKDRIEIARYKDLSFTRGDFKMAVMRMPAEDKPDLRTRGDVRVAVQAYIDGILQDELAERLAAEGKIAVADQLAQQRYFERTAEFQYDRIMAATSGAEVGLSEIDFVAMKAQIAEGIEGEKQALLREAAIAHQVQEALTANRYEVSDTEWRREYEIHKTKLIEPATASIKGVLIRADRDEAFTIASDVRKRLDAGETVDAVMDDMAARRQGAPLRTTLRYNPADPAMAPFSEIWGELENATPGQIVGPAPVMPVERFDPATQTVQQTPPALLVCVVEAYSPDRPLTLDEALENENARAFLARNILTMKVEKELRETAGVEIYDDALPDPAVYDTTATAGPLKIRQQNQQVEGIQTPPPPQP